MVQETFKQTFEDIKTRSKQNRTLCTTAESTPTYEKGRAALTNARNAPIINSHNTTPNS